MFPKHIRQEKDHRAKNLHAKKLTKRLNLELEKLANYRRVLKQQKVKRTLSSYQFNIAQKRVFYHSNLCNSLRIRIAKNTF